MQLELRKQIDAICDRFEIAWDGPNRPRLEEYLDLLPESDRPPLLAELLASELSLRGKEREICAPAEYAQRFPQYADVVDQVFDGQPPAPADATADPGEQFFKIIQAFQLRRQSGASTNTNGDGEQNLRALATQLALHSLENRAAIDLSLAGQLWLSILHACRERKTLGPVSLDALVRDLIESFPASRQSILIDLLTDRECSSSPQTGGVTRRTLATTVEIATKLLEQAR